MYPKTDQTFSATGEQQSVGTWSQKISAGVMMSQNSYLGNFVEVVIVLFPIGIHVVDQEREVLHHCHHQILHVALDPGVTEGSEAMLQSKCFVWSIAEGDKPHLTKLCLA